MMERSPFEIRADRRVALGIRTLLGAIFVGGLAVRVYFALACHAKPDFSDMAEYNRLAVEGGLNTFRAPLYPLFLRAVYKACGDYDYRAVYIVQGVLSSLVILLMYGVVARIWSRRAGLIAAALCAVYPTFVAYNLTTLTESLSILCVAAMMSIAVSPLRDGPKAIAQGALSALAMLVKPAFLFFVPGLLITTKKRGLFLLVLAVILAPWIVGNAMRFDRLAPVSDSGALMFYRSYNPDATGQDNALIGSPGTTQFDYFRMGLDFIRRDKLQTIDILANKVFILLKADWDIYVMQGIATSEGSIYALRYGYVAVMILGFLGLARLYRREHRAVVLPAVSYLVLIILLSAFKYRYRVLIEPLLVVYASMLLGGARTPWRTQKQEDR